MWHVRNGEAPEFLSQLDPERPNYEHAEFRPVIRIVAALGRLGLEAKQVYGLGFRVYGLGFRVYGLGFRV